MIFRFRLQQQMDILITLIQRLKNREPIQALETGTIRSYHEKHESSRIIGENIKGKLLSIDNSEQSIKVAKDICKHLNNIEWRLGDSLQVLKTLPENNYDLILLDSVNEPNHIFEEFKIALTLIKPGGTIMIDDFGVSTTGNIPDKTQPQAKKGVKIYTQLKEKGHLNKLVLHQSKKGVQGIVEHITSDFKQFKWE